ncbi:AraC family transcriptional regulator [Oxalobacteraceae bacterium A2-2]
MDALSHLLSLYPLQAALDIRCHFGAPWLLEHEAVAAGAAPYHVITRGAARLDAGGLEDAALEAGDIVLFPHGGAHRLYLGDAQAALPVRSGAGGTVLLSKHNGGEGELTNILCGEFRYEARRGHALLAALPPVLVVRSAGHPEAEGLRSLIALLQAETETARPGASLIVAQLASALFALLVRAWLAQQDGEHALAAPGLWALLAQPRLQPALLGMLAEPERAWTMEQMAAACHVSRATFARLFGRAAGATPAEVLLRLRMARAAQLLDGGAPPGAVGEAVGYQSEAAFHRAFKRQHGMGPGAWRRQPASARHGDDL